MSDGCYIKAANDSGDIWLIFEPSGVQIGACSTHDGALRIADIANSRMNAISTPRQKSERGNPVASVDASVNKPESVVLNPVATSNIKSDKPVTIRPALFDWYAPQRRRTVWSFLKKML